MFVCVACTHVSFIESYLRCDLENTGRKLGGTT